jgi:hypothetical protein
MKESAELEERMNVVTETTTFGEHTGGPILQPVCIAAETEIMTKESAELEERMNVVTSQRNTLREHGDTL